MKKYQNKKLLIQLYLDERMSANEIGKSLGCSHTTIYNWLKKYKISIRTLSEAQLGGIGSRNQPFLNRFWGYIDKNGPNECWNWTASCTSRGYGQTSKNGESPCPAHIVVFELYHNRKVKKDHVIHHVCGNKKCCNPGHLQEFTDFEHKSLHHRGEKSSSAKLTKKQVLEIRAKYNGQYGQQTVLAKEYGVDSRTINYIIKRKNWKHI